MTGRQLITDNMYRDLGYKVYTAVCVSDYATVTLTAPIHTGEASVEFIENRILSLLDDIVRNYEDYVIEHLYDETGNEVEYE